MAMAQKSDARSIRFSGEMADLIDRGSSGSKSVFLTSGGLPGSCNVRNARRYFGIVARRAKPSPMRRSRTRSTTRPAGGIGGGPAGASPLQCL